MNNKALKWYNDEFKRNDKAKTMILKKVYDYIYNELYNQKFCQSSYENLDNRKIGKFDVDQLYLINEIIHLIFDMLYEFDPRGEEIHNLIKNEYYKFAWEKIQIHLDSYLKHLSTLYDDDTFVKKFNKLPRNILSINTSKYFYQWIEKNEKSISIFRKKILKILNLSIAHLCCYYVLKILLRIIFLKI